MPSARIIETLESLCISTLCRWLHRTTFPYLVRLDAKVLYPFRNNLVGSESTSISGCLNNASIMDSYTITDDGVRFFANFKKSYCDTVPPLFHNGILSRFISLMTSQFGHLTKEEVIPEGKDGIKVLHLHELYFCVSTIARCLLSPKTTVLDLSSLTHIAKKWSIYYQSCDTELISDFFFQTFSGLLCSSNNLDSLTTLKLPHFVDDTLIQHISHHCQYIEHLILRCVFDCRDFESSKYYHLSIPMLFGISDDSSNTNDDDDDDIDVIQLAETRKLQNNVDTFHSFGCKYLKTLFLPEGSEKMDYMTAEIYTSILSCMKELEFLVGFPLLYLLQEVDSTFKNNFIMKNFHHGAYPIPSWVDYVCCDYEEDTEDLDNICSALVAFSNIDEISIYATPDEVKITLEYFSSAKTIMLYTDDFAMHKKYLTNLVKLDINIGYQAEWPILVTLSSSCPDLEEFTLRSFTLRIEEDMIGSVAFPKLLKLQLIEQEDVDKDAFSLLTLTCPLLNHIMLWFKLGNELIPSLLNDSIIKTFAQMHPYIEKFIYKLDNFFNVNIEDCSPLTYEAVNHLIFYCPNLKCIGNLDSFSTTIEEKQDLLAKIKLNNWDLEVK